MSPSVAEAKGSTSYSHMELSGSSPSIMLSLPCGTACPMPANVCACTNGKKALRANPRLISLVSRMTLAVGARLQLCESEHHVGGDDTRTTHAHHTQHGTNTTNTSLLHRRVREKQRCEKKSQSVQNSNFRRTEIERNRTIPLPSYSVRKARGRLHSVSERWRRLLGRKFDQPFVQDDVLAQQQIVATEIVCLVSIVVQELSTDGRARPTQPLPTIRLSTQEVFSCFLFRPGGWRPTSRGPSATYHVPWTSMTIRNTHHVMLHGECVPPTVVRLTSTGERHLRSNFFTRPTRPFDSNRGESSQPEE